MASGPITSWQIDGETVEIVSDFIFWGSKITADGDWSHEIKRRLLLGRKVMTDLDSTLKSRDIALPTKVYLVKAMVFPVIMYGCESWTVKKAECQRIDAFELWCWRRLLESPLDCKEIQPVYPKGDQSWVFIGRTDAEAETPILWPPCEKSWLTGKDPDAGRDWGQEEKGMTEDEMTGWHHRLNGREFGWTWGVGDREAWRAVIHGVAKSRTRLSDWTELRPSPLLPSHSSSLIWGTHWHKFQFLSVQSFFFAFVYMDVGEGNGNPLQYSCLENSMDKGTWWATVQGVAKSQTPLSD